MMLPKELRQVLKLSGGKIVVSEGDIKESYVVMALSEYLNEREINEKEETFNKKENDLEERLDDEAEGVGDGLTNEVLLDRINADIAELHQRKSEIELEQEFEQGRKKDGSDIRYEEVF